MSSTRPTRTTRTAPSGPNGRVIAIAIGLVVALAAITALLVGGGDDDETVGSGATDEDVTLANYGAVVVDGETLPPLPASGDDPAIGATAPTITSEQASGTTTVDPAAEGGPMLIVFLAHWCPHCQAELPSYVELAGQGELDGLRTVAVATSTTPDRPNYPPSAWLDEEGWTGDRFYDDREGTAAAAYGLTSFPYTVIVDADGKVVDRFSGEQPDERILAGVAAAT